MTKSEQARLDLIYPWLVPGYLSDLSKRNRLDQALLAAWAGSLAAYFPDADYVSAMAKAGWGKAGFFNSEWGAQAGYRVSDRYRLICIDCTGSESLLDWVNDFMSALPVRWGGVLPDQVKIGWGFKRQAARLWSDIFGLVVASKEYTGYRVIVGGHSLGGILAEVLGAGLAASGFPPAWIAAIEPPRGFRPFGRDWYRGFVMGECGVKSQFMVNTVEGFRDGVTQVFPGFDQVGDVVILGKKRIFTGADAVIEWKAARADQLLKRHSFPRWGRSKIRAHFGDVGFRHLLALTGRA